MTTKRWTTYLFPILFLIVFTILIAVKAHANNTDNGILWRLGFYYYMVPFTCLIIFSTLKSINVFKEGEENNTELTIISKPFKRWQIILAKFFVLYTLFILYSLIVFCWMFVTSFVDKPSTNIEKLKFAASLSIGGLVIMFLTSSIVVLISQVLSSVITILIMGIAVISPLATAAIAPLTHAQHLKFVGTPHYMVSKENIDSSHVNGDQMFFFNPSGIKTAKNIDKELYGRMKREYKRHKKSAYQYVAYFDVYEQLSGFLSMFQDRQWNYESIGKWHESTRVVHSDYQFIINGWKYIYMYWNDSKFNELTASKVNKISKQAANYVVQHKDELKWKNFALGGFLKRYKSKEWKELVSSYLTNDSESFDENALQLSILIAEKENNEFKKLMYRSVEIQDLMYIKGILADGGVIPVYVPEKYIPKINIFLGWGSLMIILGIVVGIIYYRKDFK